MEGQGAEDNPPDPIATLAAQIRPAWERNDSKRAIARSIGREYAGYWATRIDAAIRLLEAAATAAATTATTATTASITPEAA